MNTIYSTYAVAVICGVAPRTVLKWCNEGLLPCYRIADTKDRRIMQNDLLCFLKKYEMNAVLDHIVAPESVLLCGLPRKIAEAVESYLPTRNVRKAFSAVTSGKAVASLASVVVIDSCLGMDAVHDLVDESCLFLPNDRIVLLIPEDGTNGERWPNGVKLLHRPVSPEEIAQAVKRVYACGRECYEVKGPIARQYALKRISRTEAEAAFTE